MSNISDIIEAFIIEQLDEYDHINLSRNELASYFNCAPSQINYVLSTRFTHPRGFIIESHRGGGGYISLQRVDIEKDAYLKNLLTSTIGDELDYNTSLQILEVLKNNKFLSEHEVDLLKGVLSNKTLASPLKMENKLRANILRNIIVNILKGE